MFLRVRNPFPNNRIPLTQLDSIAGKIQSYFPPPSRSGLTNNFEQVGNTSRQNEITSVKIDHNFNANNRFFARFSISDNTNVTPDWIDPSQPTGGRQYVNAHTFVMDYVRVLNPSMVLDVRYAFAKQRNKNFGNANLKVKGVTTTPGSDAQNGYIAVDLTDLTNFTAGNTGFTITYQASQNALSPPFSFFAFPGFCSFCWEGV